MRKLFTLLCTFLSISLFAQGQNDLKFVNGQFKIVQFTDIHYINNNKDAQSSLKIMENTIKQENPNLVVFTGDVVVSNDSQKGWEEVLAPVIEAKVPFVVTFGNHDDEATMSRKEIYDYITSLPYNVNGEIPENVYGVTNHALEIKNSNGEVKSICWIFDSNAYSTQTGIDGYGWIDNSQIEWYSNTSKAYTTQNGGIPLPSIAFLHIPLPEFALAYDNPDGVNVGTRGEPECSPKLNSGLFLEIIKRGDIMGVFAGHDHDNDYVSKYYDILLGYGRFTGSNTTYNSQGRGARTIILRENEKSIETWINNIDNTKLNFVNYPRDYQKGGLYYRSENMETTSYSLGVILGEKLFNSTVNKDELNWSEVIAGMKDVARDSLRIEMSIAEDNVRPYFLASEVKSIKDEELSELERQLEKEQLKTKKAELKHERRLARQEALAAYTGALMVGLNEYSKKPETPHIGYIPQSPQSDADILNYILKDDLSIKTTPSGNYYSIINKGFSVRAKRTSKVTVEYDGMLLTGYVFDSTYDQKKPITVDLAEVMPGFAEALTYIGEGGRVKVWIPAKNVFGRYGMPGKIPVGAAIMYDIKLVKIVDYF